MKSNHDVRIIMQTFTSFTVKIYFVLTKRKSAKSRTEKPFILMVNFSTLPPSFVRSSLLFAKIHPPSLLFGCISELEN